MRLRRRWGWLVVLACFWGLAGPVEARAQAKRSIAFSDEAVERAIKRAKDFLWSMYDEKTGHWPEPPMPKDFPRQRSYHGGYTALACYALLAAGESYQEPRLKRAMKWLATVPMNATYCLALRCQVWTYLPREMGKRALLRKDATQLINSICQPKRPPVDLKANPRYGTYTYVSSGVPGTGGDHSNTQFGILGVWAAAREHLEVPQKYWRLVYKHFEAVQNRDGGWGYGYSFGGRTKGSKATMTAAGLASMFVAFDNLHATSFTRCGQNPVIRPIQRGLDWFDRHYSPSRSYGGGPYYYYLYAVERVGLASGYKYFGKKDWYKLGATRLINTQSGNGSWSQGGLGRGPLVSTAFALLFLVRGRAPVLFNRLEYSGDWNNRPRALANLMRWTSRKFEGEVNWQIINLKAPVEEWHDAPILLITGSRPPKLSDADLAKLRRFVYQGGLLLTITECGGRGFDAAWRGQPGKPGLYAKLFPGYELRQLPPDHPIYTVHFKVRRRSPLWAVSNGIRILALHTTDDLPLYWQTDAHATRAGAFELAFNIVYYATDRASLRHRGTSPWPQPQPIVPLRMAKVARLKYQGNWDPEPLAWERFAMLMGQHWQTKLIVEAIPISRLNAATWRVAHLTGTTALHLSPAEKAALKAYVACGGTLVIDAAGGSETFADSAQRLLEELFGAGSLRRLPSFSPVYRLKGMEIRKVGYRRAAREKFGRVTRPRLMGIKAGTRIAVFLSREDLTSGLAGYPCFGCVGYAPGTVHRPGSAIRLMRNIVLYGHRPLDATKASGS